jgi:hypothetical protein
MPLISPAYRATVMAPRSVDLTEATPLSPAASSPHTDPFKVSTLQHLGVLDRGTWSGATLYNPTDIVLFGSSKYIAKRKTTNDQPGWQAMSNPEFASGLTGYDVYDNGASGSITLTVENDATAPNASGKRLHIAHTTAGSPSPGFGGFVPSAPSLIDSGAYTPNTYRRGQKSIISVIAKIPVGYTINLASNSIGTGNDINGDANGLTWITPQAGTGDWAFYAFEIRSGTVTPWASTGHIYLTGPSRPVDWYVAGYYLRTPWDDMWQPYLLKVPQGRRGRLDVRERKTDTGGMLIRLIDKRTGATNLSRWMTGFIGDALGNYNLMGLKIFIEESLDGGLSWRAFYTGRITDVSLDSKAGMQIQVRDMGEDLNQDIFVGTPHASVRNYAVRAPLLPRNVVQAYGIVPIVPLINAHIRAVADGNPSVRDVVFDNDDHYLNRLITENYPRRPDAIIAVIFDGGVEKWYNVPGGASHIAWHATEANRTTAVGRASVTGMFIDLKLAGTGPLFAATFPTTGSAVTLYAAPRDDAVKISKDLPLLINDIHGVQLWKDILDGKFSRLDSTGAPKRPVAYDATAFATLIADTSFPPLRFEIEELDKMNTFIEDQICTAYNLTYYLDSLGRVVPVDLRRVTGLAVTSTITDADRVEKEPVNWAQARDDAITRVDVTFYREVQDDPDTSEAVNQVRISVHDELFIKLNLGQRTLNLAEQTVTFDLKGLRYQPNERMADGTYRPEYIKRYLDGLIDDYWGPFTNGAQYLTLGFRRTTNTNVARPGTFHLVDVDPIPDPTTNRRGGARLALCIERTEAGPNVTLGFLDLGFNATAIVPVVGVLVKNATDGKHGVDIPITLNASGEAVQVMVALTATSVGARPAANSQLWQPVGPSYTTSGTKTVLGLAAGSRVWVRARSLPNGYTATGAGLQQPSDWVFPTIGSVDLDPLAAPGALTVANISQSTADVSWSLTDTASDIEVLLTVGTITTWTDDLIVARLPANTRSFVLRGLEGPTVQHTVGVRHRSSIQGYGPPSNAVFTTTSTPPAAPRPAGLAVGTL